MMGEREPEENLTEFWINKIVEEKTAKLQADLAAAQAKLGTAQSQLLSAQDIITSQDVRIAALEAENERLLIIIRAIQVQVDTDFNVNWHTDLNKVILQLLQDEIEIKRLCIEALQPAKEAE